MMWIILRYPGHLSLDVASQFVAITDAIRRDSRSMDYDRRISIGTFGAVPSVTLAKRQRRLLIRLVRNIQCKCIKIINAFGDGGWDLGRRSEVKLRG